MGFCKQVKFVGRGRGSVVPFCKIGEKFISPNVALAGTLHGYDYCDTYIDKDKKAIMVKGNPEGAYTITRLKSQVNITCMSLLKGETVKPGRIYEVELLKDGFIVYYGDSNGKNDN